MPDEVARIGALSNGSNGQRSLESASLHFWAATAGVSEASRAGVRRRNRGRRFLREGSVFERHAKAKDLLLSRFAGVNQARERAPSRSLLRCRSAITTCEQWHRTALSAPRLPSGVGTESTMRYSSRFPPHDLLANRSSVDCPCVVPNPW
jgi:hypothetical protein